MKYAKLRFEKFDVRIEKAEALCRDEANRLYMEEDIDFEFYHYDAEVRTLYVLEHENTTNPVEHKHLKKLEQMIKKEVDERWYTGIIWRDPELFQGR